jgi:hypothetical protein
MAQKEHSRTDGVSITSEGNRVSVSTPGLTVLAFEHHWAAGAAGELAALLLRVERSARAEGPTT